MARITGEVTIDAPVEEVFDLVADERNEPTYNSRMARAEMVTPEPVGAGSRFVVEPKGAGRRGRMAVEVLAYERPHQLRTSITSSYLRVDGTLTFTATGRGTRLRWDWHMGLVGPFRVLSPVLRVVGPSWERRNWLDLKDHLETRRG